MKKRFLLLSIYFVLNIGLISGIMHILFSASPLSSITFGIILYALSIGLAFSPIGEWIIRFKEKARNDQTILNVVNPLFKEVYKEAKIKYRNIPNGIKILVNDGEFPNACAIGRRTICVTKTITELSDNEIKAVLSHELGHLINRDTYPVILITIGNIVIVSLITIIRLIINFIQLLGSLICLFIGGSDSALFSFINATSNLMINIFINGFMFIWTKVGQIFVIGSTNKQELDADQVAIKMGYGKELCDVLKRYEPLTHSKKVKLFAFSHPEISERIRIIETNI